MVDKKIDIRPLIKGVLASSSNGDEEFQNRVLRPVIKLQKDLIFICFENFIVKNKIDFFEETVLEKQDRIAELFQRNMQLVTDLRSLIIGLLTVEEYVYYLRNRSNLNKRIHSIIKKRVLMYYS